MGKRFIFRREVAEVRWELGGFDFSFADLVRLSGLSVNVLQQRLMAGWALERAVTTPVRRMHVDRVLWIGPVVERERRVYL